MAKIKTQKLPKDIKYALILGFLIGVFLLPVENNFDFTGLIFLKFATLFGFPLVSMAGIYFSKLLFSGINSLWQFAKFFLVGLTNTAINIGVLNYLIVLTGENKGFALTLIGAVSFTAAVVNSYIWNTHWSFKDQQSHSPAQFHKFLTVTFSALLVNSIMISLALHLLRNSGESLKLQANIADLFALAVSTFWNFFGYKYWAFKHRFKKK